MLILELEPPNFMTEIFFLKKSLRISVSKPISGAVRFAQNALELEGS